MGTHEIDALRLLWIEERSRIGKVCTTKYPFDDWSAAAAIRDQREASVNLTIRSALRLVVWLCRFILALFCAAVVSVLRPGDGDFGVEVLAQHSRENERLRDSVRKATAHLRPSRCLVTGDLRTLVPFLAFRRRSATLDRWWLRVPRSPSSDGHDPTERAQGTLDDEACALDVSWPAVRGSGATFLVLHVLNGGSNDKFVRDLLTAANRAGSVAAVLINRGCMGTPVRGTTSLFSGARTCDVGAAVDVLKMAIDRPVCVVGFSMGGIIAANYAVRSGKRTTASAVVCVSGSLCAAKILDTCGDRSRFVWQPPLAGNLKASFYAPNSRKLALKAKTTGRAVPDALAADTVDAFDRAFVCYVHDYRSVVDYYEDLSAAGHADEKGLAKFARLHTPLLVIHAKDDPIVPFESIVPDIVVQASPRVVVMATRVGGHVGWPATPYQSHRWDFMTSAALAFCETAASFG